MKTTTAPLAYVYDGRECLGFVVSRGRAGFEAFDRDERSLGLYPTAPAAANAVFATENGRAAGKNAHAAAIPTNQSFVAPSDKCEAAASRRYNDQRSKER